MSTVAENNKRIAKNTLMLYIRMFLTMAIGLYTSRVVLNVLGVEDYGIYGAVGSVVAMFSFFNGAMTGATQRFLNYVMGRGSKKELQRVFCSSLLIHIVLSLIVVLVAETVGLWFLYNKMTIPPERMYAALWCFHLSVLSAVAVIMSVPYNAVIVAHEKMDVFAYISIIEVVAKLLIVFSLLFFDVDKLILYAVLLFIVQIVVQLIYLGYCRRNFEETKSLCAPDRKLLREMSSFAGFDLYGGLSVTVRTQGVNMLLNVFFGLVLNAAAGIAVTVQSVVTMISGNVIAAVKPQIVQSYSMGNIDRCLYLINKFSLLTFVLLLLFSMPLIVDTEYVLWLWLGEVPPYASSLCRLTLLFTLFANLSSVLMAGLHATGKIKKSSFINGTLYLSVVPVSYFAYKMGFAPECAFVFNVVAVVIGLLLNACYLSAYVKEFSFSQYFKQVFLKALLLLLCFAVVLFLVQNIMPQSFVRLLLICAASLLLALSTVFVILGKEEQRALFGLIRARLFRKV